MIATIIFPIAPKTVPANGLLSASPTADNVPRPGNLGKYFERFVRGFILFCREPIAPLAPLAAAPNPVPIAPIEAPPLRCGAGCGAGCGLGWWGESVFGVFSLLPKSPIFEAAAPIPDAAALPMPDAAAAAPLPRRVDAALPITLCAPCAALEAVFSADLAKEPIVDNPLPMSLTRLVPPPDFLK